MRSARDGARDLRGSRARQMCHNSSILGVPFGGSRRGSGNQHCWHRAGRARRANRGARHARDHLSSTSAPVKHCWKSLGNLPDSDTAENEPSEVRPQAHECSTGIPLASFREASRRGGGSRGGGSRGAGSRGGRSREGGAASRLGKKGSQSERLAISNFLLPEIL